MKNKIIVSVLISLLLSAGYFVSAQTTCALNGEEVPCGEVKGIMQWLFGAGLIAVVVSLIFFLAGTIIWISMIAHASSKPIENKKFWIAFIILLGAIGAIIYYFAVKRKFDKNNTLIVQK